MIKKILLLVAAVFLLTSCSAAKEQTLSVSTREIADVALNSVEFPMMMPYTEQSDMEQYLEINFDDIDEITCEQQMMSVHLAELIIIKPKEGRMDAVMEYLQARQDKLKNDSVFYPSQQAAADAVITGSKYNVAYLICNENAPDAEKALLEFLDKSVG